jgi:hypothetical protein
VWIVSFYALRVKGIICNSVELGNDNRGKVFKIKIMKGSMSLINCREIFPLQMAGFYDMLSVRHWYLYCR